MYVAWIEWLSQFCRCCKAINSHHQSMKKRLRSGIIRVVRAAELDSFISHCIKWISSLFSCNRLQPANGSRQMAGGKWQVAVGKWQVTGGSSDPAPYSSSSLLRCTNEIRFNLYNFLLCELRPGEYNIFKGTRRNGCHAHDMTAVDVAPLGRPAPATPTPWPAVNPNNKWKAIYAVEKTPDAVRSRRRVEARGWNESRRRKHLLKKAVCGISVAPIALPETPSINWPPQTASPPIPQPPVTHTPTLWASILDAKILSCFNGPQHFWILNCLPHQIPWVWCRVGVA